MTAVTAGARRRRHPAPVRLGVLLALTASFVVAPVASGSASALTAPPAPAGPPPPLHRPAPPLPLSFVKVSVSPANGSVVGIAYPITARFSAPVSDRAAAEHHMSVFVNGRFSHGAWFWKDPSTAVFRTQGFWPGHAHIDVRLSLRAVELARSTSYRFVGSSTSTRRHSISTARSFLASVNALTHRMSIRVDGKIVKVFKVSLGRPDAETRSGIKAVMEKYVVRHMTSVAAGITDPQDQYDLQVPYAVRITPTGEFVHGAPWATGRIGIRNGSHGCTNLFVGDSKWFFDHVVPGDPVVTTGTGRTMEFWNGTGAPYNMPWKQWLARSALKGAP